MLYQVKTVSLFPIHCSYLSLAFCKCHVFYLWECYLYHQNVHKATLYRIYLFWWDAVSYNQSSVSLKRFNSRRRLFMNCSIRTTFKSEIPNLYKKYGDLRQDIKPSSGIDTTSCWLRNQTFYKTRCGRNYKYSINTESLLLHVETK